MGVDGGGWEYVRKRARTNRLTLDPGHRTLDPGPTDPGPCPQRTSGVESSRRSCVNTMPGDSVCTFTLPAVDFLSYPCAGVVMGRDVGMGGGWTWGCILEAGVLWWAVGRVWSMMRKERSLQSARPVFAWSVAACIPARPSRAQPPNCPSSEAARAWSRRTPRTQGYRPP